MRIKRFESTDTNLWNQFIQSAKNSTFLFHRNFMGYHAERFHDFSLLVFNEEDSLVSVLPANKTSDNIVISHQGLTYGGIVLRKEEKLIPVISIVYSVLKFFHENDISIFDMKCIPSFYNPQGTREIDYIFFLLNAELYRRDTALVIDRERGISYSGNIRREANKAEKMNPRILEEEEFGSFWESVLIPNLKDRFNVLPVHSLSEIQLLKTSFPDNIRQFSVYVNDSIVAGATLFITPHVVHCQYISANETGRKTGCLNLLLKYLIDEAFVDYRYFDFGIVNENEGKEINKGMLFWKESFGARIQNHDFYKIKTSSYTVLEKFLS